MPPGINGDLVCRNGVCWVSCSRWVGELHRCHSCCVMCAALCVCCAAARFGSGDAERAWCVLHKTGKSPRAATARRKNLLCRCPQPKRNLSIKRLKESCSNRVCCLCLCLARTIDPPYTVTGQAKPGDLRSPCGGADSPLRCDQGVDSGLLVLLAQCWSPAEPHCAWMLLPFVACQTP